MFEDETMLNPGKRKRLLNKVAGLKWPWSSTNTVAPEPRVIYNWETDKPYTQVKTTTRKDSDGQQVFDRTPGYIARNVNRFVPTGRTLTSTEADTRVKLAPAKDARTAALNQRLQEFRKKEDAVSKEVNNTPMVDTGGDAQNYFRYSK